MSIYMSLIFFAIGFSGITALAISIIGWLSLDIAASVFVWPSLIIWLVVGVLHPAYDTNIKWVKHNRF